MRFIRDRELNVKIPDEVHNQKITFSKNKVNIIRSSLNELAEYEVDLECLGDTRLQIKDGLPLFESPTEVRIRVRGLSSEKSGS